MAEQKQDFLNITCVLVITFSLKQTFNEENKYFFFVSVPTYVSPVETNCMNIDFHLGEMAQSLENLSENEQARLCEYLFRAFSHFASFVLPQRAWALRAVSPSSFFRGTAPRVGPQRRWHPVRSSVATCYSLWRTGCYLRTSLENMFRQRPEEMKK